MSIVPEIVDTKNKLEYELKILEKQIFELETSYLQETLNSGKYLTLPLQNTYLFLFYIYKEI